MNVDLGLLEWALGGILTVGAMISGYLYRRLVDADRQNEQDNEDTQGDLDAFKLHVAQTYAPKSDLKDAIDGVKQTIRDSNADLKDFIKVTMGQQ